MNWSEDEIRDKLNKDHDRIYNDIDQMKIKIQKQPERFRYEKFIGQETGKLNVCILLKDLALLNSPYELLERITEMEQESDEKLKEYSLSDDVNFQDFKDGWQDKLKELKKYTVSFT